MEDPKEIKDLELWVVDNLALARPDMGDNEIAVCAEIIVAPLVEAKDESLLEGFVKQFKENLNKWPLNKRGEA